MALPNLQINQPRQARIETREKLDLAKKAKQDLAKTCLDRLSRQAPATIITQKPDYSFAGMYEVLKKNNPKMSNEQIKNEMAKAFVEKMETFKAENPLVEINSPEEYLAALALNRANTLGRGGVMRLDDMVSKLGEQGITLRDLFDAGMEKEALTKGGGLEALAQEKVNELGANKMLAKQENGMEKDSISKEIVSMRNLVGILDFNKIETAVARFENGEIDKEEFIKILIGGGNAEASDSIDSKLAMVDKLMDLISNGALGPKDKRTLLKTASDILLVGNSEYNNMGGANKMEMLALGMRLMTAMNTVSKVAEEMGETAIVHDMALAGLEMQGRLIQLAGEAVEEPEEETASIKQLTNDDVEYILESLADKTIDRVIARNQQNRKALADLLAKNREEIALIEKKTGQMIQKRIKTAEKQRKQKVEKKLVETNQEINAEAAKLEAAPMAANETKLAELLLKKEELRQKAKGANSAGTTPTAAA
ncbi:hypothetical protein ACFL57_03105 [Candidatus Margulisiibacteriota bacterium]